jgi:hypothetical protein
MKDSEANGRLPMCCSFFSYARTLSFKPHWWAAGAQRSVSTNQFLLASELGTAAAHH